MKIFSNLAVSADGKIADLRDPTARLGSKFDFRAMDLLRQKADAVLMGSGTLASWPFPIKLKKSVLKKTRLKKQPLNVILTRSGNLPTANRFWDDPSIIRFVFTTENGFSRAFEIVKDRAFLVAAGKDEIDLSLVLKKLSETGVKNLLIEGGGQVMESFLRQKYLHEMYLTWTPWLVGGKDNPGLVGGSGLLEWSRLKILKVKKVKQELYFHLKVLGSRRV